MKRGREILYLFLFLVVVVCSSLPNVFADWDVIAIYNVKNWDNWQSAKFTIPENAGKIRLTFDITVDNPSGKYALYGTLIDENSNKWEFQGTQGFEQVFEFENIDGTVNLSLLMTLAHATLTVEYFVLEPIEWSEVSFPSNIKSLDYTLKHIFLFEFLDCVIYENLEYDIINVNYQDNYFDYRLTSTYRIIEDNENPINGIKLYFNNNTIKEYLFSKSKDFEISVSKRAGVSDGKIFEILSGLSEINNSTILYGDKGEMIFQYFGGVDYVPLIWNWYYEPRDDYTLTYEYNSSDGLFECYKCSYLEEGSSDAYFIDVENGLFIYDKYMIKPIVTNFETWNKKYEILKLNEAVYFNNFRNMVISFPDKSPIVQLSLQENTINYGDSLNILGNIDPVPEDKITIILTSPVIFRDSDVNRKMLLVVIVDKNGDFNIRLNNLTDFGIWYVQAFYEGDLVYKEIKSKKLSFTVSEYKTEEASTEEETSVEESTETIESEPQNRIPGYPLTGILLGLISLIILVNRNDQVMGRG